MQVKKLQDLVALASGNDSKKLVVACAQDPDIMEALSMAMQAGFISPLLIGDLSGIKKAAESAGFDLSHVEVIHESDPAAACGLSVSLVRQGHADLIMKGHVSTGIFTRQILDRENGLMRGDLLSHVAFFETQYYHKILCITDAALNIAPGLDDKIEIIRNAVAICSKLGIRNPKVGVLAAVEVVNDKMEATVHAARLKSLNREGTIQGCIVDGPLALDNAISAAAAQHKGIVSDVAGDADVLVVPDINSGNILYKSLSFLGGAFVAGIVAGARVPVVLTSRSDSDRNKFFSVALATALL
ncbi:MAG: bifunctional enoyl-CoA hydratase/phosphate acetyltransferase [Bacteroidales bacterium]|nr:bifunctional enoyl-CoA hydratase/phosphate acetyltransferase [Bacteroidales bacterium]